MKAHRILGGVIEGFIKACMFIFISYLSFNIKTYKIKLISA